MSDTRQYCSFFVDRLFMGVDVRQVQEVLRAQEIARVPLASREIGGLINLRGQIVTAIDLRRRLLRPERTDGQKPMNVVIRTDDGAVSLLVDEIHDTMTLDTDSFENTPETLTDIAHDLVDGVYKLKNRLMLVLNTKKAVNLA